MKNKYPVTLYLNQKYVFDLLAIIENGISYIETIKSTESESNNSKGNLEGEVGASNIFALIGIKLSGGFGKEKENSQIEESTKEKVHTPNSLFAKLREVLYEEKSIKNGSNCQTGDFVEIKCKLNQNPLISVFQGLFSAIELAAIFEEPQQQQKHRNKTKNNESQLTKKLVAQIKSLVEQIESGETIDIMGETIEEKKKLIISLDKQYLNDPTLADLKDGEFTILGKVTKILKAEDEEKINLLRKTKLSAVGGKLLEEIIGNFSGMESEGFYLPEIETEISGPAIQILPIGIFT